MTEVAVRLRRRLMDDLPGLNPAAPHHLPAFVTAPGQSDWLMTVMAVFLLVAVVSVGLVYLKLHALPEHMAHRTSKVQLQFVAVLALLALFTHNHVFWIAGAAARARRAPGLLDADELDRALARDGSPAATGDGAALALERPPLRRRCRRSSPPGRPPAPHAGKEA